MNWHFDGVLWSICSCTNWWFTFSGHAGAAGLVSLLGSDGGRRRPTTWDRLRAIQGGTTARISETAKENLVEGFDDNKVPSL